MTTKNLNDIISVRDKQGGDKMRTYLKELRKKAGFTQQELANKLFVSQNYYSSIEKGERQEDMNLSLILNLSKVLEVPVELIIKEEKNNLQKPTG